MKQNINVRLAGMADLIAMEPPTGLTSFRHGLVDVHAAETELAEIIIVATKLFVTLPFYEAAHALLYARPKRHVEKLVDPSNLCAPILGHGIIMYVHTRHG